MSNETKWTPGPWVVTESTDEVAIAMGTAIDSPYEYTCGHVWMTTDVYWSDAESEDVANAHLIAAAPDGYDSNVELVDALLKLLSGKPVRFCELRRYDEVIDRARSYQRKARGES